MMMGTLVKWSEIKVTPVAFFIIVLYVCAQQDIWGTKSASSKISKDLFQQYFSSVYYEPLNQSKVGVFLFNDQYLKKYGLHWPLDYTSQLKIFSEILKKKPKAVYLNFLYQHAHENRSGEIERFIKSLQQIAKDNGNIPIVIPQLMSGKGYECWKNYAHDEDISEDADSLLSQFENSSFEKSFTKWEGCKDLYPLYLSGSTRHPSPALKMYSIYCDQNKIACRTKQGDSANSSEWEAHYHNPLDVQWGYNPTQQNSNFLSKKGIKCQTPVKGFFELITQRGPQFYQTYFGSEKQGVRAKCPYTDTFYANWFKDSINSNVPNINIIDRTKNLFESVIADRYVFVGVSLAASRNYIQNPINGQIADIYLHAMVFDNLITYNEGYIKPLSEWVKFILEAVLLFFVTLIINVVIKQFFINKKPKEIDIHSLGSWIQTVAMIFIVVFVPLMIVLVCCALVLYLGYTPLNWVGILLAASVIEIVLERKSIFSVLSENTSS